ncbi:hypothetical protein ACHAQA_009283 [Verticillium albo-atrum]
MADSVKEFLEVPSEFAQDGIQFMKRCTKPDRAEYQKLAQAVGVGFLIMGAVKLIHIPVNNILVGGA